MAEVEEYETQIVPSIPYGEEGYYTDGVYEEEIIQSLMTMGLGRGRAKIPMQGEIQAKMEHAIGVLEITLLGTVL